MSFSHLTIHSSHPSTQIPRKRHQNPSKSTCASPRSCETILTPLSSHQFPLYSLRHTLLGSRLRTRSRTRILHNLNPNRGPIPLLIHTSIRPGTAGCKRNLDPSSSP